MVLEFLEVTKKNEQSGGMVVRAGAWTQIEMLRVLCTYACLEPAERLKPGPEIISALQAHMPWRTADSLLMRFSNYVARDKSMQDLGYKGLFGGGNHVDEIWDRFAEADGSLDLQALLMEAALSLASENSPTRSDSEERQT